MLKDRHVLSAVLNMARLNSCSHAFRAKIQCPLICFYNMEESVNTNAVQIVHFICLFVCFQFTR